MVKKLLAWPPAAFIWEVVLAYGRTGVSRSAAALSYFLILTLFPLLMCINYFIGLFHLDLEQLVRGLDQVLPDEALAALNQKYVSEFWGKPDAGHTAVRFCTGWSTRDEDVDALIQDIAAL